MLYTFHAAPTHANMGVLHLDRPNLTYAMRNLAAHGNRDAGEPWPTQLRLTVAGSNRSSHARHTRPHVIQPLRIKRMQVLLPYRITQAGVLTCEDAPHGCIRKARSFGKPDLVAHYRTALDPHSLPFPVLLDGDSPVRGYMAHHAIC